MNIVYRDIILRDYKEEDIADDTRWMTEEIAWHEWVLFYYFNKSLKGKSWFSSLVRLFVDFLSNPDNCNCLLKDCLNIIYLTNEQITQKGKITMSIKSLIISFA